MSPPNTPLRAEFPCWGVTDEGVCRCPEGPACTAAGKHPKYGRWLYEDHPIMAGVDHVGFRTGSVSGIGVFDLDTEKGKVPVQTALAELEAINGGPLPRTFTVRTPNGGLHLHYRIPDGCDFRSTVRKMGRHIDTRGEAGLVVLRGRGYEAIDSTPPVPMPEALVRWMEEYLAGRGASPNGIATPRPRRVPPPARGSESWTYAVDVVAAAFPSEGQRHDARLALGGAFLWYGWTVDEATAFVVDVYAKLGASDSEARIREPIENASRKMEAGMRVVGWGGLYEALDFDAAERLRRTLGMKDEPIEMFGLAGAAGDAPPLVKGEASAKMRRPGHTYTFELGARSAVKAVETGPSELTHFLMRHPAWSDPTPVIWWDARAQKVRFFNPPFRAVAESPEGLSDTDVETLRCWLECTVSLKASSEAVLKAVRNVAFSRHFDPVVDYLDGLPEGRTGAIADLCREMKIPSSTECGMVYVFLVGAVARAYQPSVPMRHMLILQGDQLAGKSSWVRIMFGEWAREGLPPPDANGGKEAALALRGYWGVEIPELATWLRGDEAVKKDFLTRLKDTYRPPYGALEITVPRSAVFIGTTNEDVFLSDPTGESRYLPVRVGSMDLRRLVALRDEVWAEARDVYKAWDGQDTPPWYMPEDLQKAAEEHKDQFRYEDAWRPAVEAYCKGKTIVGNAADVYVEAVCNNDPGARAATSSREARRMAGLLQRLGFRKTRHPETRRIVYEVPETLR